MSKCTCTTNNSHNYHGTSNLYHNDPNTPVIALLGQPNSGKSTIFNMMTGSHQHVGNWSGKTVEQKEGQFKIHGKRMILADQRRNWHYFNVQRYFKTLIDAHPLV